MQIINIYDVIVTTSYVIHYYSMLLSIVMSKLDFDIVTGVTLLNK